MTAVGDVVSLPVIRVESDGLRAQEARRAAKPFTRDEVPLAFDLLEEPAVPVPVRRRSLLDGGDGAA